MDASGRAVWGVPHITIAAINKWSGNLISQKQGDEYRVFVALAQVYLFPPPSLLLSPSPSPSLAVMLALVLLICPHSSGTFVHCLREDVRHMWPH